MVEKWQIMTVANFGRVVTGKTPPTAKSYLYGEGYPIPNTHGRDHYSG